MAVAESAVEAGRRKLGLFRQFFRFIVIGGGCALIDIGSYALLLSLGLPIWLARSTSFVLGTGTSYLLNRRLTFRGANTGNTALKAGGFVVVYVATFFVNIGTNQASVILLNAEGSAVLLGLCWVIGQGLGTLINFVMLKWVVFRD
ncbi:GtrA family protein [Salinifilum aidingensis]